VAGRVQGDPRPLRRPPLRLIVAAGLVASIVVGALVVLPRVERGITRDSRLTALERRHAAGDRLDLDGAKFDAFRAQLTPRERYSVDVPPGPHGPFITRGAIVRAYSAFYFLPGIQVRRAPHVFHYRFR
jgi:hypothetical protein